MYSLVAIRFKRAVMLRYQLKTDSDSGGKFERIIGADTYNYINGFESTLNGVLVV